MFRNYFFLLLLIWASISALGQVADDDRIAIDQAKLLFQSTTPDSQKALQYFESNWSDAHIPLFIDVLQNISYQIDSKPIVRLLQAKTGQRFGHDLDAWRKWMWNRPQAIIPNYGDWMGELYKRKDPLFLKYFQGRTSTALVRLDEVQWGGVKQDGIPPLRQPNMINAEEASYLNKGDVVFGISINGDHRAYPKRILAWHEMFVDEVGGIPLAGVYCTLCGTVIAYDTRYDGKEYHLGTSGFLYRSNKLMYDRATQSLWSTIEGKPVIGPLVDKGIHLSTYPVVTTTWNAWKKQHPDTKVLSLKTGHIRDYNEGIAYQEYFATDHLMFAVPQSDKRLKNKDEVLIIRSEGYKDDPLAISARYLNRKRIYHDSIEGQAIVVITDKSGSNRAYASKDHVFSKMDGTGLIDTKGGEWTLTEEALQSPEGLVLKRLPSHRIFWFAWFNAYPETRLVK